jgi:hypothetical protein
LLFMSSTRLLPNGLRGMVHCFLDEDDDADADDSEAVAVMAWPSRFMM